MTDHHRQSDDVLIELARQVGVLSGVQNEIKDTLSKQWERQRAEDLDHAKIKSELRTLNLRMEDVPKDKHHTHHDYIEEQIQAARERADLCKRARIVMLERALPYAFLAMLAAGLYAIGAKHAGMGVLEWIQK